MGVSLPQNSSVDQKKETIKILLSFFISQPSLDLTSCLFGLLVSYLNYKIDRRAIFQLKNQFLDLKSRVNITRQLKKQDAVAIVLHLIDEYIKNKQKKSWKPEQLPYLMHNFIFGMIDQKRYFQNDWEQENIEEKESKSIKIVEKIISEENEITKKTMEQQVQLEKCEICIGQMVSDKTASLSCNHKFHSQCVRQHIKTQIEANNVDIRCPLDSCNKVMETKDIFEQIDGEIKEKYQNFSFNKFVEMDPENTIWCPTPKCGAVFENDKSLDHYRCPNCKKHYCLKCKNPYHRGKTCAESCKDKNEQKFKSLVEQAKYKQCPRCKYYVERKQGCNRIICKCGQKFCYNCGGISCRHKNCLP